jgi:hypothetical protein
MPVPAPAFRHALDACGRASTDSTVAKAVGARSHTEFILDSNVSRHYISCNMVPA